ncbi:nucleoside deaminase [Clostridium sp.]|uniref:nucleoside deaminase n=1 Tax=Clostridium sp. TaxID=1506 RepID=UPI0032168D60
MWNELSNIWKEAFSLAWESFKRNTIPIGAVIVNEEGNIISRGRNRIFDETSNNPLAGRNMAHAEMTAMINLREKEHPNIKKYTLYTTMEPCPMCFGTMVMMGIRNLRYAARDGFAGATELNHNMEYIKSKKILINKEEEELELFHICLQSVYEYGRNHKRLEEVLDSWRTYCREGVLLGKQLCDEGYFLEAIKENKYVEQIYDEVIHRFYNI